MPDYRLCRARRRGICGACDAASFVEPIDLMLSALPALSCSQERSGSSRNRRTGRARSRPVMRQGCEDLGSCSQAHGVRSTGCCTPRRQRLGISDRSDYPVDELPQRCSDLSHTAASLSSPSPSAAQPTAPRAQPRPPITSGHGIRPIATIEPRLISTRTCSPM
jgi:hypothetical protein